MPGHRMALMTGLAHTTGDLIFLSDCDLDEEPYPSAKGRLLKSPSIAEPGVILGDVRVRSVHKIGYGHDRDGATA